MKKLYLPLILIACWMSTAIPAHAVTSFELHAVDALEKIPRKGRIAVKQTTKMLLVEAVRGEYESAQAVIVAQKRDLQDVSFTITATTDTKSSQPQVSGAFLGYVPIRTGTSETEPADLVALAPTELPDPILDKSTVTVPAGMNQALWLTIYVPRDCPPGDYMYSVEVSVSGVIRNVLLKINVADVTLPEESNLFVTNWIYLDAIQKGYGLERWSEPFWDKLREYAEFVSRYRQNVIFSPIFELIEIQDLGDGQYKFNFDRFDRWVALFDQAGVAKRIEGSHLVSRIAWDAPSFTGNSFVMRTKEGGLLWREFPDAHNEEYTRLLEQLLAALQGHLEEQGWLDRYLQHIADEPIQENLANYLHLMANLRRAAPKLKTMDAIAVIEVFDAVDIPVVSLEQVDRHLDFINQRKKNGKELWFYTCLNPRGPYLNRLIDFHLIRTRLLHWINFHYELPGYGHWALNLWPEDPFKVVEKDQEVPPLPPGDTHVVYPGEKGILSSIRLEAMRDGIEDYELLRMLAQKDPKTAKMLASKVVQSGSKYERDSARFRRYRQQLISALQK